MVVKKKLTYDVKHRLQIKNYKNTYKKIPLIDEDLVYFQYSLVLQIHAYLVFGNMVLCISLLAN